MTSRGGAPRNTERGVDTDAPAHGVDRPRSVDPSDPAVSRRLRRTAWTLAAVMIALAAGAACYIAKYGRSSRTVLHSRAAAARAFDNV